MLAKVDEEVGEMREATRAGELAAVAEELGDLLFSIAQAARHLGVDPETALRAANAKFERRFRDMEAQLAARGQSVDGTSAEQLEALWAQAKRNVG